MNPDTPDPGSTADILGSPAYLRTTYGPERAPQSSYPLYLARWLMETVYGRTGSLLDVGCGRGDYLDVFSQLGFSVAGVDISPAAPSLAPHHTVKVADLNSESLPFPADSFDFLFSKSVIEHTHQPVVLLTKACQALKPGGTAVIMTPSWRHTYWGAFYVDHTHVTPFTAPSLTDALGFAGFEVKSVIHFRQLPFLWRWPVLSPLVAAFAALRLPYRPMDAVPWPESVNKFIRFAREPMLLAVARRPAKEI